MRLNGARWSLHQNSAITVQSGGALPLLIIGRLTQQYGIQVQQSKMAP